MEEVLNNLKKYEDIAEKRSVFYNDIDRALEVVKQFILEKNRILYGGMAIDLSLKLSGHPGIYANDAIPDYDFMSPTFYDDSNELAVILSKLGFENVSAIHAIHLTSRRVRVNFIPVADITYVPQEIYDKIPTRGSDLRIVHPDFQRMDMHRAFSTGYEKPPGEVFLQRTKKDIKRFKILQKQYPIVSNAIDNSKQNKKIAIDKKILRNNVIGGFLAYALLYKFWKKIGGTHKSVIFLDCNVAKKDIIFHHVNGEDKINIITDDYVGFLNSFKSDAKVEYYNKFLDDLRPRTIITSNYEIFDNFGRKLPVFNLSKLLEYWEIEADISDLQDVWLCQTQYVLLYFLMRAFENPNKSDFYMSFYNSLCFMIADMEFISFDGNYDMVPFFLTANTYGKENWSPDYINTVKEKLANLAGIKVQLRPNFGFYPKIDNEQSQLWDSFDFSKNELFLIDGKLRSSPFEPLDIV